MNAIIRFCGDTTDAVEAATARPRPAPDFVTCVSFYDPSVEVSNTTARLAAVRDLGGCRCMT
jgi:hypothetical protein